MRDSPLVIVSFNRPHYLAQVLDSLAAQTAFSGRRVLLFQDNAVNPFSRIRHAADEEIAACVGLFKQRFPDGEVHLARHNLGIALNFRRAEEFVFNHVGSDVAYFFEDDMVLSPHYLAMMDRISEGVRRSDTIGYFSAYGQCRTPRRGQHGRVQRMRRLNFHWAFGLNRRHWLELSAWLSPYYRMIEGHDYRHLPKQAICRQYLELGIPLCSANQDIVKRMGTYALGRVSLNTHACFARYIGAEGVHSKQAEFDALGYGEAEMYPEPVELSVPTKVELSRYWDREIATNLARWTQRSGGAAWPNLMAKPAWYIERDGFAAASSRFGARVLRPVAQGATTPLSRRNRTSRALG